MSNQWVVLQASAVASEQRASSEPAASSEPVARCWLALARCWLAAGSQLDCKLNQEMFAVKHCHAFQDASKITLGMLAYGAKIKCRLRQVDVWKSIACSS